jgi:hypothetical protein
LRKDRYQAGDYPDFYDGNYDFTWYSPFSASLVVPADPTNILLQASQKLDDLVHKQRISMPNVGCTYHELSTRRTCWQSGDLSLYGYTFNIREYQPGVYPEYQSYNFINMIYEDFCPKYSNLGMLTYMTPEELDELRTSAHATRIIHLSCIDVSPELFADIGNIIYFLI